MTKGLPDFHRAQLYNETVYLDILREIKSSSILNSGQAADAWRPLAIGKSDDKAQTKMVALPAESIADSRRVSRRTNRSTEWILYGGKSADSAGGRLANGD